MIREATIDEFRLVATMAKNFEDHTSYVKVDVEHTIKEYKRIIESGTGIVFALIEDGKVVGGVGGVKFIDIHYPRLLAVETFWFVLPEYRGGGIKLLIRFEQWAKDNNCERVAFIHLSDSHPEILKKIYTRRGYTMVETHYEKVIK